MNKNTSAFNLSINIKFRCGCCDSSLSRSKQVFNIERWIKWNDKHRTIFPNKKSLKAHWLRFSYLRLCSLRCWSVMCLTGQVIYIRLRRVNCMGYLVADEFHSLYVFQFSCLTNDFDGESICLWVNIKNW